MKVKVKKLVPEAKIPKYAKEGDAGLDLTVTSVEDLELLDYTKYGFGLAFEIPVGYVGLLFPRSSCYKKDQVMSNAVGVIDSSYRGEVSAVMIGMSDEKYEVGERAAQLIIMPYQQIELEEAEELSETERGQGGFGSTGVK